MRRQRSRRTNRQFGIRKNQLLGVGEIRAAMDEENDRSARLTCEFCHKDYTLPHERLSELLAELESERIAKLSDSAKDRNP